MFWYRKIKVRRCFAVLVTRVRPRRAFSRQKIEKVTNVLYNLAREAPVAARTVIITALTANVDVHVSGQFSVVFQLFFASRLPANHTLAFFLLLALFTFE